MRLLWTRGGFAAPPQDCFSPEANQKLNLKQPKCAAVFGRQFSRLSAEGAGRAGIPPDFTGDLGWSLPTSLALLFPKCLLQ